MGQGRREFYAARTCADQHERHLSRAFVLVVGRSGQFERAQDFGSDRLGVAEALETRCISSELVVPEIAGTHTGRDHQIIERNLADARARGGRLNRAGSNVDAGDLRQEYADVSLLRLKLADRRSDLSGREDGRRHLIEQRLKYVVVAAVYQDDLGIGVPQRVRRGDSAKAAANDDHTLLLARCWLRRRQLLSRASFFKGYSHFSHLVIRALQTPGSKTAHLPFSRRGPLRWVPHALSLPWRATRAARAGPRRAPPPNRQSCVSLLRRERSR